MNVAVSQANIKNKAQLKFWKIPELVAQRLDILDPGSVLELSQCHQFALDLPNR